MSDTENKSPGSPETPAANPIAELLDRCVAARERFWQRYGKLETGAMTSLVNARLKGAPKWPAQREAFLRVDRSHSVLLATDGLSDPYPADDSKGQGLGIEFYIESRDKDLMDRDWESMKSSWLFQALYMVAQNAAYAGNFRELLDENGLVSIELNNVNAPEAFLTDNGRVGVLIGVEPKNVSADIKLPLGKVKLASVVMLTKSELEYAIQEGPAGRKKLDKLFRKKGFNHLSSAHRDAVVK